MRRAVKPLAICLLCLAAPVLFISLGIFLINLKPSKEVDIGFRVEDGHIQYTEDGEYWKSIISISDLTGVSGTNGREVEIQTSDTHIQWKYTDEENWRDLILLESIKGLPGSDGKSAYEIALEKDPTLTVDQWLADLKGEKGDPGKDGSIWHSGSDYSAVTAKVGDFFYDEDDCNIYKKTESGWVFVANTKGEAGEKGDRGTMWYTGTDLNAVTDAQEGDLFLKTDTSDIYQKQSTGWQQIANIKSQGVDQDEYTVSYYYGVTKGFFKAGTIKEESESISAIDCVSSLPVIQDVYAEGFKGWFIQDTDIKIAQCEFVGRSEIILEPRFYMNIYAPAGLYENGVMFESWEDLTADGSIVVDADNKITSCNTSIAGDLVISESITAIAKDGFKNCKNLTGVVIKSGVSIGESAFYLCTNLTNVIMPDSVTSIDKYAFWKCSALTSFTIPAGVTTLSANIFRESGLTEIVVPDTVTDLGDHVFYACRSLKKVVLSNNIISMGEGVFRGCYNLEFVNIPTGISTIPKNTFISCVELTDITIPDKIKIIGESAFYECISLTQIKLPSSITEIKYGAFMDCVNLNAVYISSETVANSLTTAKACGSLIENARRVCIGYAINDITNSTYLNTAFKLVSEAAKADEFDRYDFIDAYTITYDYSNLDNPSTYFVDVINSQDIIASQWITTLPEVKEEYKSDFKGWFIKGTDKQIKKYDFIGSHITLVPIFNITANSPAGLYENGVMVASWDELTAEDGLIAVDADNKITSCNTSIAGDLIISSDINEIGEGAFRGCVNLNRIIIHEGVSTIADHAFEHCDLITSITIPASVNAIGINPFTSCINLSNITVVADNPIFDSRNNCNGIIRKADTTLIAGCKNTIIPEDVTTLGEDALFGCTSLTQITIPTSVTSIGEQTFGNCKNLTKVDFAEGSNLTTIGEEAFYNCSSLKNIVIPSTLTKIDRLAFNACTGLTNILIPTRVSEIGDYIFRSCISLNTIIVAEDNPVFDSRNNCNGIIRKADTTLIAGCKNTIIPEDITTIGVGAFSACSSLTEIAIPTNVTKIADGAFYGCKGLTRVVIPESVTEISKTAFKDCVNLVDITISSTVTTIGAEAFSGCGNLYCITINSQTVVNKLISATALGNLLYNAQIVYVESTLDTSDATHLEGNFSKLTTSNKEGYYKYVTEAGLYQNGVMTASWDNLISQGLINVTDGVITDAESSITGELIIPNTITGIGDEAFAGCTFASITIPANVTSIGSGVFTECDELKTISVDSNNEKFYSENNAIITRLDKVLVAGCGVSTIPEDVIAIGKGAFYYCNTLERITIPRSVTTINANAFRRCSKLQTVTFADYSLLSTIGSAVFRDCTSLSSISIPSSVTSIDWHAFFGCTALKEVSFNHTSSDSVEFSAVGIFQDCKSLAKITMPANVTAIPSYTFANCYALQEIKIPAGVTEIGASAFENCTSLMKVTIDSSTVVNGLTTEYTHFLVRYAQEVYIPSSITDVSQATYLSQNFTYDSTADGYLKYVRNAGLYQNGVMIASWDSLISQGLIEVTNGVITNCDQNIAGGLIIPNTITGIGDEAFSGCEGLTSVIIPEGVTSISWGAFSGCAGLTSVTIPEGVTSIGAGAFSDCISLKEITIPASVERVGYGFFDAASITSIVVAEGSQYYSSGDNNNVLIELSTGTLILGCSNSIIPEGVTNIGEGAFSGCTGLTSVIIPEGVTNIGERAFSGCAGLTSVTIPEGVTSIGYYAFSGCTGLTSVTIPDSVESIGTGAFEGCIGLTSVTISEGVTSIGGIVFRGCIGLTSVTIPDSVESIGAEAFSGCTGLTSVTFIDTNTWKYYDRDNEDFNIVSVYNTKAAAQYLTITYCEFYWKKF